MLLSMSAKGNAYDNAKAESFFKTLKQEEVYFKQYQTFEEASANLGQFILARPNKTQKWVLDADIKSAGDLDHDSMTLFLKSYTALSLSLVSARPPHNPCSVVQSLGRALADRTIIHGPVPATLSPPCVF
jgi:transposase InsO family protein